METPSVLECNYNVQPMPGDVPHVCGRPAVRRATSQTFDMLYCRKHWTMVMDLPREVFEADSVQIKDLTEDHDC
jgi:hypothetical protein